MAVIQFQETGERITDKNAIDAFLSAQEVIYEKWDISKLPDHLRENYTLSDEDKQQVLDAFSEEIQDISERRGYQAHDVISLSDSTPNLDELLTKNSYSHRR
jgi:1,2-dihydroxy-3-keto-5-methylthiopentene dioxygenase